MTSIHISYQDLLLYGAIATGLIFCANMVASVVIQWVTAKTSITELRKLVDDMPADIDEKQGKEECVMIHTHANEVIQENKQAIAALKKDTEVIRTVVTRVETKLDTYYNGRKG